jgi:tetratricopeptide (TPR) repeat protein
MKTGPVTDYVGGTTERVSAQPRVGKIPEQAQVWLNKGVALAVQGRLEEALSAFEEALKQRQGCSLAWYDKGTTLGELGRYDEALAALNEALRLSPDYSDAWDNKGIVLSVLGRGEEALACHEQAIRLDPTVANYWHNKGLTLGRLGRLKEALAAIDQALRLQPEYRDAWHNRAAALGELRRYEEALQALNEALRLSPDYAEGWYNKGVALEKLGRFEEARQAWERALALKDQLAERGAKVYLNLGALLLVEGLRHIQTGALEEAEKAAREFIGLQRRAKDKRMGGVMDEAVNEVKAELSKKELKLFDEFELMLTILSIEDPLERWKTLARKIGEKWPKGVSAVQAIREERE